MRNRSVLKGDSSALRLVSKIWRTLVSRTQRLYIPTSPLYLPCDLMLLVEGQMTLLFLCEILSTCNRKLLEARERVRLSEVM
jgi:hypothetical protein